MPWCHKMETDVSRPQSVPMPGVRRKVQRRNGGVGGGGLKTVSTFVILQVSKTSKEQCNLCFLCAGSCCLVGYHSNGVTETWPNKPIPVSFPMTVAYSEHLSVFCSFLSSLLQSSHLCLWYSTWQMHHQCQSCCLPLSVSHQFVLLVGTFFWFFLVLYFFVDFAMKAKPIWTKHDEKRATGTEIGERRSSRRFWHHPQV